tara:strand:+ start:73 stop:216 length:144 start_codon:yes stop_codon:yes gene_type:complete
MKVTLLEEVLLVEDRVQLLIAVLYMIPCINYGEVARDEHCLVYGATC